MIGLELCIFPTKLMITTVYGLGMDLDLFLISRAYLCSEIQINQYMCVCVCAEHVHTRVYHICVCVYKQSIQLFKLIVAYLGLARCQTNSNSVHRTCICHNVSHGRALKLDLQVITCILARGTLQLPCCNAKSFGAGSELW